MIAIVLMLAASQSFAGLIEHEINEYTYMSAGSIIERTHDISPPYVIGTPIESATLTLKFRDDSGADGAEYAIAVALGIFDIFEVDSGARIVDIGPLGLADIRFTGDFTYVLAALYGDFVFKGSKLSVLTSEAEVSLLTRQVSEPGSLLLLGVGLLLLAFTAGRRRITA